MIKNERNLIFKSSYYVNVLFAKDNIIILKNKKHESSINILKRYS